MVYCWHKLTTPNCIVYYDGIVWHFCVVLLRACFEFIGVSIVIYILAFYNDQMLVICAILFSIIIFPFILSSVLISILTFCLNRIFSIDACYNFNLDSPHEGIPAFRCS